MRLIAIQILVLFLFCGLFAGCNQNPVAISETALTVQATPPNVISKANTNAVVIETKYFSPPDTCQEVKSDGRLLCEAIIKDQDLTNQALMNKFVYASKRIDLNDDRNSEVIVWVPVLDLGGTSGYPILIFSETSNGYQKLKEIEQGWTPIFVLKSKNEGWKDLAFQIGGGGADWQYVVLQHNGKTYQTHKTQKRQPEGELLIDKDWNQSVFGPIPKQ